jgi:hypothetical protein
VTSKRLIFVVQHVATTFLISFLLAKQAGMDNRNAALMSGVVAARDLKSLFDNIFDIGLSQQAKKDLDVIENTVKAS